MQKLVIIDGAEAGRSFDLNAPELVIGRQAGVQIRIDGLKVSRRHARLIRDSDGFRLEDLGSSNGTLHNGRKLVAPVALKDSDQIGISTSLLRYEDGEHSPQFTILAQTVASPANSDLYVGNAARKLEVILKISTDLGRSLDSSNLLNRVLEHLFDLFPQAERVSAILLQDGSWSIRAQKHRAGLAGTEQFSKLIVNKVSSEGLGIFAEDVAADERFAGAQSILCLGTTSLMCVPLSVTGGKRLGVLQLERKGQGRQFTAEDLALFTAIGLQVSVALDNAQLHQDLLARQRIDQEVALAREIQLSYLPSKLPDLPIQNFELHAELLPANEISGDFYDYFNLGQTRLVITVADVCGKGVPAALFMSMIRALLRNVAEHESDPGLILRELNNKVVLQNPKMQFVTISLGVFDPSSRTIELASAGHPAPLTRLRDGSVRPITIQHGPLLGFMDRSEPYPTLRHQLNEGDLLLLYTDGITEAPAADGSMFGSERLEGTLAEFIQSSKLERCAETLRKNVRTFTGSLQQEDDITMLMLRVR